MVAPSNRNPMEPDMSLPMSRTLKFALLADAAASGGAGLMLIAGSFFMADMLGLPAALMLWIGVAFIPWAIGVGVTGAAASVSPNASDGVSGLASQSCAPVVTSSVGAKTVNCTASDNACLISGRSSGATPAPSPRSRWCSRTRSTR